MKSSPQTCPQSSRFDFNCPSCGRLIKGIHTSYVGSKAHCKKCKQPITVPLPPEEIDLSELNEAVTESKATEVELAEETTTQSPFSRVAITGGFMAVVFLLLASLYPIQLLLSLSSENKQLRAELQTAKLAEMNSKSAGVIQQLKTSKESSQKPEGLEEVRQWLRENLHAPEWYEVAYCPPNPAKRYFKDLLNSCDKAKAEGNRRELAKILIPDGSRELFEQAYFKVSRITIRSQIPAGGFVKNDHYFYFATYSSGSKSVIAAYPLNEFQNTNDTFEKAVYKWLSDSVTKDLAGTEINLGSAIHR